MAKRLLIFGGSGFVGGTVARLSRPAWDTSIAGSSAQGALAGFDYRRVDVARAAEVDELVRALRPDAVIHAAALSAIDRAETERELAYRINVEGAANVARACRAHGARCVFISTDAVFDGVRGGYREEDLPAPVNYYGYTKSEAERAVAAADPAAAIVRVSLVLGFPVAGGNSFLAAVKDSLAKGKEIPCATDEVRTPIDVGTLACCLLELAAGDFAGILHLGSTGAIDRCELTRRAARLLGYGDTALIKPLPPGPPLPGKAPRHKNGTLVVERARARLATPMLDLEQTLKRSAVQ